ncbi:hypothetical protein ONZ43_g1102 [Nemania bipapillata]|uniref:Uncharacterized protein n=1 Tax=Nemania bipapillata TaxID=110536 RepID=A0ACC2J615_9PEZI|nr:hypothetical protein ONZ43_g1102 [Nemania bipapillata]
MAARKTVLITGCSDGGIGSALATTFQQRDFHVFATARDPSKMGDLKDLPHMTFLKLDVTNTIDIKEAVKAVAKHAGRNGTLDVLISNAGRNHFMPILDDDLDVVRNIFEINFLGPIALTQAFAPMLIKAKGMIAYITSTSGYLNVPYMGTYSASKRSLEIVGETLRLEIAPFGVDYQQNRLYKSIESTVAIRAQGGDGLPRMDTLEYANSVTDDILARTTGRVWYGGFAEQTKMSTTATGVPQTAMDSGALMGTDLDKVVN